MKKQILMVVTAVAMFGAVVSGAFSKDNQTATTVRATAASTQPNATDKLLAKLNSSPASVPLARPL
jgi:outer membrane murein-binding lipoprotein Lpp